MSSQHIVIFGGSSGIGLATACHLLASGARVTITGRDETRLVEAGRQLGPEVQALLMDAAAADALPAQFAQIGKFDHLVLALGSGVYAEFELTDAGAWRKYVPLAQASLAEFGARYVVGGGDPEVLEGDLGGRRISILEFESPEKARDWYHSPQYQAAKATRLDAARLTALLFSGPKT
jgi:uncharacterized protein (DUF1330 family)